RHRHGPDRRYGRHRDPRGRHRGARRRHPRRVRPVAVGGAQPSSVRHGIATTVASLLPSLPAVRRSVLATGLTVLLVLTGLILAPRAEADAGELAKARARANQAAAELADAETRLGQLDAEIKTLEARAADAEARINELRTAVRELAVQRFVNADAAQLTYLDPDTNVQARA